MTKLIYNNIHIHIIILNTDNGAGIIKTFVNVKYKLQCGFIIFLLSTMVNID